MFKFCKDISDSFTYEYETYLNKQKSANVKYFSQCMNDIFMLTIWECLSNQITMKECSFNIAATFLENLYRAFDQVMSKHTHIHTSIYMFTFSQSKTW